MEPRDLLEKVKSGQFTLGVVGLGRVGLPLALAFVLRGVRVIGIDVDRSRIAALDAGTMPFIEDGGEETLREALASGLFEATADITRLADADAIFITVGTVLNNELRPDYSQIQSVLSSLAGVLRPVQILMLRSTVSPGTLSKIVARWV